LDEIEAVDWELEESGHNKVDGTTTGVYRFARAQQRQTE